MREVQSDHILDLVQLAAEVETQIETHIEVVAARLEEVFAPFSDDAGDAQVSHYHAVLRMAKDKLGDSRQKLIAAEEHFINLVKGALELRDERQTLTEGLYGDLSSMRRTVEELYRGRDDNFNALIVAGIQGPTARRPTKLLRQVDLAIQHLRQPGLEFPPSRFGESRLEPHQLAAVLAPRAERLHQVKAALRQVESEIKASRKEKNQALAAHKETFLRIARHVEALFRLADEPELADRIRRTTRRRSSRRAAKSTDAAGDASQGASSPPEDAAAVGAAEAEPAEPPAGDAPSPLPAAAKRRAGDARLRAVGRNTK